MRDGLRASKLVVTGTYGRQILNTRLIDVYFSNRFELPGFDLSPVGNAAESHIHTGNEKTK